MKDKMNEYIKEIDRIIKDKETKNINNVIEKHLIKIKFYQHERLVHFLVTMLFAIMFLMTFLYSLKNMSLGIFLLELIFLLLLVPYIFYYYHLENNVQYMYEQYDELIKLKK